MIRTLIALLALGLAAACAPPADLESDLHPVRVDPEPPVTGATDAGVTPWETGWCRQLAGGPAAASDVALSLSALHARARYFGAERSGRTVDEALVGAARSRQDLDSMVVRAFGLELDSVCVTPPDDRPLPAAQVEFEGTVAVVRPGSGAVSLPAEATAAVLDLRDLPDAPGLREAILAAAGELLDTPLPPLKRRVFQRVGLTDEAVFQTTLYALSVEELPASGPTPEAVVRLPLAVLTSERLPPAAAELAAALRVAGRAWVFGADVPVAVAEATRAASFADASAAVRTFDLVDAAGRFPDVVHADRAETDGLQELPGLAFPEPLLARTTERTPIAPRAEFQVARSGLLDAASLRAALLTAHGAAKLFFPYFDTLGDHTDERLAETLAAAPAAAADRRSARDLLRRFGNALEDGHGWVYDNLDWPAGRLPLLLDHAGGDVVVTRSYSGAVAAGDEVTAVDGEPIASWLAQQLPLAYGATEGFRRFTSLSELVNGSGGAAVLELRDTQGATRTVTLPVTPWAALAQADLHAGSTRPHGWLADLGAPDVYYFNLDGRYAGSDASIGAHLAQAASARGLVLDMRGHPASGGAAWDPYQFLRRIIRKPFDTPRYRVPVLTGPEVQWDVNPHEGTYYPLTSGPMFAGPVVLIVDPRAVSFAEDFSMMLIGSGRVTKVVGRPTAGTTGSVTGLMLPGGFSFYLTGMEARWPDGRPFFGEGAVPDVFAEPNADDLAAGVDAPLVRAIAEVP